MKAMIVIVIILCMLTGCTTNTPNMENTESRLPQPQQTDGVPSESSTEDEKNIPEEDPSKTEETVPIDPLEVLLNSMTLEERVGQLFLASCPSEAPLETIAKYHLGGLILFGRDFEEETPDSFKKKLEDYQSASRIPLLIAVDEEGGSVCRVSDYEAFRTQRFSSPRNLLAEGGIDALLKAEREKSLLLQSLGINVNVAPVCDITTDPSAFMYSRSMGLEPEETARIVESMVDVMDTYHVGSVLKHFPGYGNNTDTHIAMAVDNRSLETLEKRDLVPFRVSVSTESSAVMVSHTIVAALDSQNPATLSPAVHKYLRDNMGFEGVIVTDDLAMGAITNHYGSGEAAVLAVLAGNDLLCTWEYEEQYSAVLEAARSGRISAEMIDDSVMRILIWKQRLGLLDVLPVSE